MSRSTWQALMLIMATSGCAERKPSFSNKRFIIAKLQCKAMDAYVIEAAPNTIGFHGTSGDHTRQAKCLKEKLAKTDVQIVVLGSRLYKQY